MCHGTIGIIAVVAFSIHIKSFSLAGIMVKRSRDVQETAAIIKALWLNFQTAPSKHGSLHQMYSQPSGEVFLTRPSLARRVAKELDDIGWTLSAEVASRFPTVRDMVEASVKDWKTIPGIGAKIARKVVSSLGSTP